MLTQSMIPTLTGAGHPRLTHHEAVSLVEGLTQLVDAAATEAEVNHTYLTPSRRPMLVIAMRAVGIDPAVIHAYQQTGILVCEGNEDLWSADDLRRWEAAVAGYRSHPASTRT